MKKRVIAFAIVIILIIPLMSFTVFAASDGGSFWDVVDGLWDVGSNIINSVSRGISNVTKTIGDGLKVIGGFFANLIKAIGDYVDALLSGIRRLFVPTDDYFPRANKKIRDAFGEKFGSVIYLADFMKDNFSKLSANKSTGDLFILRFPQNHTFMSGTFDVLGVARGVLPFIRAAFSGFITLMTVAFCYHRVLALINT